MSHSDSSARSKRSAIVVVAIAGCVVPYAWWAVAGPHLFDAGEIVAAGAQLGASHPPGQPLHALLAWGATLLPFGPIAFRISLLSVFFAAAAAFATARLIDEAIERAGIDSKTTRFLPSAGAIAVLGAPAIAPQIGRPEVYTLALALTVEATRRLVVWAARDPGREASALRSAALLAGLAFAVHPPHAFALVVIGASLLGAARRDRLRRPRTLAWAALACISGMLVILYLPLRAVAGAPTWGDPLSPSGLLAYLTGTAYRRNLGLGGDPWTVLSEVVAVIGYVLVPSGLVALAAIALLVARRAALRETIRKSALGPIAIASTGALAAACLQPIDPANPDNVAYAGPAIALVIALGAVSLATWAPAGGPWATGIGVLALAIMPLCGTDLPAVIQSDVAALETLAFGAIDAPPPRALVVVRSDFLGAAWMQARATEGARPDVALLVEGLSTSSWHWRTLAPHPLYDGTPLRSGQGRGYAPWVRGAIARALGQVAVASEHDDPLEGRGVILGPYLVVPTAPVEEAHARIERAFAERTAGEPARMLPFVPAGYAGHAHGVIREVEIARAHRFLFRGQSALAIEALRRATSPLPEEATAAAAGADAPLTRPPVPVVRGRRSIFASAEDAVRELAVLLHAIGEGARAIAILEAQSMRGDDLALLQLAWILAEDGMILEARAALARYRERSGNRDAEALEARLR